MKMALKTDWFCLHGITCMSIIMS